MPFCNFLLSCTSCPTFSRCRSCIIPPLPHKVGFPHVVLRHVASYSCSSSRLDAFLHHPKHHYIHRRPHTKSSTLLHVFNPSSSPHRPHADPPTLPRPILTSPYHWRILTFDVVIIGSLSLLFIGLVLEHTSSRFLYYIFHILGIPACEQYLRHTTHTRTDEKPHSLPVARHGHSFRPGFNIMHIRSLLPTPL